MRLFIKDIMLVVVVFITVLLPLEIFVFPYASHNIYNYKYYYVQDNSDKIATLLMGNSYFENSINPNLLGDSVFDMAVSARWIYYDLELMKLFVPKMKNLKTIVFPMGYVAPFAWSQHYKQVKYYDFVHEKFMHVWYDRFPGKYFRYFFVLYGINDGNRLFTNNVHCDSLGYDAFINHSNADWRNDQNFDPIIIENENATDQIAEYTKYLKEMAQLCNTHGVRFIVITPPCHDSYNVNVRQEGLDILHGIIENVRAEYPVEYIDYLKDEQFRADSIYFNCSHLNSIGADMFALRVKKDFGL